MIVFLRHPWFCGGGCVLISDPTVFCLPLNSIIGPISPGLETSITSAALAQCLIFRRTVPTQNQNQATAATDGCKHTNPKVLTLTSDLCFKKDGSMAVPYVAENKPQRSGDRINPK